MKKLFSALFAALLLLIALTAALAQPLIYKHKFTKGALGKYRVHTVEKTATTGPTGQNCYTMNFDLTLYQRTQEVSEDGMGLLKCTMKDMKITSTDFPAGQSYKPKSESISLFVARDGRRSNIQGLRVNAENPFEAAYTIGEQIIFPDKPISVGDTWDSVVQIPGYGADMHITSTLLSDSEIIWGQKVSKIKQVYKATVDLAKLLRQEEADAGKQLLPFKINGSMDLTGSSECLFSQSKGLLLTAVSNQKAMAKMNVVVGEKSVPVDVVQEATVTSTRFK